MANIVNVVVIGAGAVGQLMASFLAEAHMHVTLVVRRQEQADELQLKRLTRVHLDGTQTVHQTASTVELKTVSKPDLIIIAVKYRQLQNIYKQLLDVPKEVPLLFVQNGLAHFDEALRLPQQTIAFCSVSFGAQMINLTTVQHRGIGLCKIGVARGDDRIFHQLQQIQNPLCPIEMVENAEQMLFEKAVLNCLINPLTAILQIKNGELLTNKHAFFLMHTIYQELTEAFVDVQQTIPFSAIITLCEKTGKNTSSMLADRIHGRKSEVETIVGAVLQKASANGYPLPTLRTLYHQVLAIEESGERY